MNDLAIKQKVIGDNISNAQQLRQNASQLASLAATFQDLLKGIGGSNGAGVLTADIGEQLAAVTRQPDAHEDTRAQEAPRDDAAPRAENRDDGRDERSAEAPKAESRDDGARNDHSDSNNDGGADHGDTGQRDHADAGERRGSDERGDDGGRQSSSDDAGGSDASQGNAGRNQDDGAVAKQSNGGEGNVVSQAANAVQQAAQGNAAAQVIAAVATRAASGPSLQEGGQAAETAKVNAAEGLATATGKVSNSKSIHAPTAAGQHGQAQGGNGQAAANQQHTGQAEARAQQAANGGNLDLARQQAAEISRQVGSANQVRVDVNVAGEQASLTSKPTATLVTTANTGGDAGQSGQSGQQAGSNASQHQAPAQNANAQAQANSQAANAQAAQQAGTGVEVAAQVANQARAAAGSANAANAGPVNGGSTGGVDGNASTQNSNNSGPQAGQALQSQQTRPGTQTQAQSQANQTQRAPLPTQSVVDQVSVKITKALQNGTDRITVQLKPADLGRVEVKMELTTDGRVMAVVTAEKQDTLDLLRRDASELQKALAEAGLKTDAGDLAFNLRGQEGEGAEGEDGGPVNIAEDEAGEDEDPADDGVMAAHEGGVLANGRIDVRA